MAKALLVIALACSLMTFCNSWIWLKSNTPPTVFILELSHLQGKHKSLILTSRCWVDYLISGHPHKSWQTLQIYHITIPTHRQLRLAAILVTTSCFTILFLFFQFSPSFSASLLLPIAQSNLPTHEFWCLGVDCNIYDPSTYMASVEKKNLASVERSLEGCRCLSIPLGSFIIQVSTNQMKQIPNVHTYFYPLKTCNFTKATYHGRQHSFALTKPPQLIDWLQEPTQQEQEGALHLS